VGRVRTFGSDSWDLATLITRSLSRLHTRPSESGSSQAQTQPRRLPKSWQRFMEPQGLFPTAASGLTATTRAIHSRRPAISSEPAAALHLP
jgi:hypothetical protein